MNTIKIFTICCINIKIDFFKKHIMEKLNDNQLQELDMPFELEEVNAAIQKENDLSSPGPDGITAVFYKNNSVFMAEMILQFLNELTNPELQDSFQVLNTAFIIPIVKASDNSKPIKTEETRPIALINEDIKIMSKVVLIRIQQAMDILLPKQIVSIKGRGINIALWAHHMIFNNRLKSKNENAFLIRLDFDKAFCRVDNKYLIHLINVYLGKNKTTDVLIKMITQKKCTTLIQNKYTDFIHIYHSLLQGSPLSSAMFGLYFVELIAMLNKYIMGIRINGLKDRLKTAVYCDDVSIFCSSYHDLQNACKIIESFVYITGSTINYDKSYVYDLSKHKVLKYKNFNGVHEKILGIVFGPKMVAKDKKELNNKLIKIKSHLRRLKSKAVNILTKVRYLNAKIIPTLLYYMPFYIITKEWIKKLNAILVKFMFNNSIVLLSYEKCTLPKEKGGLGLINTQILFNSVIYRSFKKFEKSFGFLGDVACAQGSLKYDTVTLQAVRIVQEIDKLNIQNCNFTYKEIWSKYPKYQELMQDYKNKNINLKKLNKLALSNGLQNFVVKFLLNILTTRALLTRRNLIRDDEQKCAMCEEETETIHHLFYQCKKIKFYTQSCYYMMKHRTTKLTKIEQLYHGVLNHVPTHFLKWYFIILFAIWKHRCKKIFDQSGNSVVQEINDNLVMEFMLDYRIHTISWMKKNWPIGIMKTIENIKYIIEYIEKN